MIRLFSFIFFISTFLFANTQNISLLNNIKKVVQKEEYISLAINKYILDNAKIPQTIDLVSGNMVLDWNELTKDDNYLGTDFNKTNTYTKSEIKVYFKDGFAFIQGAIEDVNNYNSKHTFVYNYYIDQVNRVNTLPPIDNTKEKLIIGTQIKYANLQKQIVSKLNDGETIIKTSNCIASNNFYEVEDSKLVYKYCYENGKAFNVYSDGQNIVVNEKTYLDEIQAPIGSKAYAKDSGVWKEYYFENSYTKWRERTVSNNNADSSNNSGNNLGVEIVSGDKTLVLRKDIGCMLVGGDIYCWGNNSFNKFGIDLNSNTNADFTLTPVMLKTNITPNNTISRIKFKQVAVNSENVCAISVENELYCAGNLSASTKLKKIVNGKVGALAMVEHAMAVVTLTNNLYTIGININGVLGNNNYSQTASFITFQYIASGYKDVYSTTNSKTFGAIDINDRLWIWGERGTSNILKPTEVSNPIGLITPVKVSEVFINPQEFVIKDLGGNLYKTSGTTYVDSDTKYSASSDFENCLNADGTACLDSSIFDNTYNLISSDIKNLIVYQNSANDTIESLFELKKDDFEGDIPKITLLKIIQNLLAAILGGDKCEIIKNDNHLSNYVRCGTQGLLTNGGTININESFDFGVAYKNKDITLSFDMYKLGTWNASKDYFKATLGNTSESLDLNQSANAYKFILNGKFDNYGKVTFKIDVKLSKDYYNQSFGLDNIILSLGTATTATTIDNTVTTNDLESNFICTVVNKNNINKLYCWGETDKSIPLLSTSLYNDSKISELNNYFYTDKNNRDTQISDDEFFNNGNLYLKYPTYIGGFDYDFKFR